MLEESTGNFSASRTVYDWFQSPTHVNLNIMIKNLTEEDVKVRLIDETLDVTCNLADGSEFKLHFNLFRPIQVNESSWMVTPSKLEIKLKKTDRKRWQSLEVIPEKINAAKRPSLQHQSPNKRIAITTDQDEALTSIQVLEEEEEDEDNMPNDGRVKYDWYQNETHVTVGVLIKNLVQDETQVVFDENTVQASLKLPDGSDYSLQLILAHAIKPEVSSFKVSQVKLELKMAKKSPGNWAELEAAPNCEAEEAANAVTTQLVDGTDISGAESSTITVAVSDVTDPSAAVPIAVEVNGGDTSSTVKQEVTSNVSVVPTIQQQPSVKSSKGPKNWDKIAKEIEEEEKKNGEGNVDDFFKELYKGADDDAKRAMMKSFQESGGTVLSTNWNEVGKEKVEVKPPEGCEFKKWD